MVFSSAIFLLVFMPCLYVVFRLCLKYGGVSAAITSLIFGSLVFYSAWNIYLFPIILSSIAVNYWLGKLLQTNRLKQILLTGVILNLCPLVFYKYAGWLTGNDFLSSLILPLGISFFTFQQIAYLVESYRNQVEDRSFQRYALFVCFFPQLIAGPIVTHAEMTKQFRSFQASFLTADKVATGLFLIVIGLAKKVLIADNLAPHADSLFSNPVGANFMDAWSGTLAYTFQIYFDFSGYCEIAIGLALLFGFSLPVNFLTPYKSSNIAEFWRRWHITLGRFFKNYVYIPLGGNRRGINVTICALFATATLSGIWHGAGLTFLLWGAMHGIALSIHRLWCSLGRRMPNFIGITLTFIFVHFAWVMFRAESLADALSIYQTMMGLNGIMLPASWQSLASIFAIQSTVFSQEATGVSLMILFAGFLAVLERNITDIKLKPDYSFLLIVSVLALIIIANLNQPSSFIYWQF